MKGFIAVDGGGSKTELVLVDILGNVLLHKIVNCTNPNDVGMDASFSTLNLALKEMLDRARSHNIETKSIFLLIAGIEFGDSKKILKDKLITSLSFKNIYIDGDLASVKESGLGSKNQGVVIIAGTGFNMAIKKDNSFINIGGWGYLADDFISGFDLGKEALVSASRAINKIGEETILVDLLEKKFSNTLWYSMKEIYDSGIKGVAALSRLVVEAYKQNDNVAKRIIDTRINKLVSIIKDNTSDLKGNIDIALFGGIFENNGFIVEKIKENLSDNYLVNVTTTKTIYGAVMIGYKNLNLNVDCFYSNFDKSYKEIIK